MVDTSVYTFGRTAYHRPVPTTTAVIVRELTQAIAGHRLQPGTKLAEQRLADHFGVSRTLVRQALHQLAQNRLVNLEPARGAFVAAPTVDESRQVFAVRRMLEAGMAQAFAAEATPAMVRALREHVAREKAALDGSDTAEGIELLGDFHVRMAELMGNEVLAQILRDLVSRSSLITLMYQRAGAARHSQQEHVEIVRALAARDAGKAVELMDRHLRHVEASLAFDRPPPTHDVAQALAAA